MYRIILILSFSGNVFSQSLVTGKCQQPATAQVNVNIFEVFLIGLYYQLFHIPIANQQTSCSTTTFGLVDLFTGSVSNSERLPNGTIYTWNGTINRSDDYAFHVTVGSEESIYYILATDNKTYMMIYTCQDILNADQKYVYACALNRTKTLSTAGVRGAVYATLNNQGMREPAWQIINRKDCC